MKKILAVGIDHSLTNTAVTVIRIATQKIERQITIRLDKRDEYDSKNLYRIAMDIENFLMGHYWEELSYYHVYRALVICREDHSFKQHGRAHLNIALSGHLDQLFIERGMQPGFDSYTVLPNVWMKWSGVKKPKIIRETKKRDGTVGIAKTLDVETYRKMYPRMGANEHELDSYFIGLYGLKMFSDHLQSVEKEDVETVVEEQQFKEVITDENSGD